MKQALIILIGLYLLLAVGYNLAMPLGAAPDEAAHAEYVRIVAEEFRLPILDLSKQSNELDPKGYEAHQPPLYYALAAPAYKIARSAGAGPTGAGRAARGVSTLIGAAGVVLVAVLVLLAVGGEAAGLALAAAAFAAR